MKYQIFLIHMQVLLHDMTYVFQSSIIYIKFPRVFPFRGIVKISTNDLVQQYLESCLDPYITSVKYSHLCR